MLRLVGSPTRVFSRGWWPTVLAGTRQRRILSGVLRLEGSAAVRTEQVIAQHRMRLIAVVAWATPPWGPDRLFLELRRRGVAVGSMSQVWRILRSHELNTRSKRWRLMAAARGMSAATEALPPRYRGRVGVLDATEPGDLVQMDCFHIGALKEARLGAAKTPGVVWQYTAIDVASSFLWVELHTTAHNPSAVYTSPLAHRAASDRAGR